MPAAGPGMPGTAGKYQELGEKHGIIDAPQNLWGRNQLCQHLDFRLLASRPMKEKISVSLSHQVCGGVLQNCRTLTPKPCRRLALDFSEPVRVSLEWSKGCWWEEHCPWGWPPQDTDPPLPTGTETRSHWAALLCVDCNCKPFHSCLQVRWEFKKIIWPLSLSHTPPHQFSYLWQIF